MLPFGMRVDNSMATNSLSANQMPSNALSSNPMGSNPLAANSHINPLSNSMTMNSMPYMMHNQQIMQQNQQMQLQGMVNGFDGSHNSVSMTFEIIFIDSLLY